LCVKNPPLPLPVRKSDGICIKRSKKLLDALNYPSASESILIHWTPGVPR
jgi:hypothetical protein